MNLFSALNLLRGKPKPTVDPLDAVLFHWSNEAPFRRRDLLSNLVGFGRTGSGKSSTLFKKLLRAAMGIERSGGLVTAGKPEDLEVVVAIARELGRFDDLIVVNLDGKERCNYLEFISTLGGDERDVTRFLMSVNECLRTSDAHGGENSDFFEKQAENGLYLAVVIVKLVTGRVTAPDLQRFISTAATNPQSLSTPQWQNGFHNQCFQRAFDLPKAAPQQHDYELAADYWLRSWPTMSSRTRSGIESVMTGLLHVMNSGMIREICSTTTTFSPHDMEKGRWIFLNAAPATYGDRGRFLSCGLKHITQTMILRRHVKSGDSIIAIIADEAQAVTTQFDSHFLAQCRSHYGCMVYLTQSLHSLFSQLSGEKGKQQGLSLLTNFTTKVFHALGSPQDAEYASSLIGNDVQLMVGGSTPPTEDLFAAVMGLSQHTCSFSEQVQPIVQPRYFLNGMRTGGTANDYCVDAIVVKSGEPFASGANYQFVTFNQKE